MKGAAAAPSKGLQITHNVESECAQATISLSVWEGPWVSRVLEKF